LRKRTLFDGRGGERGLCSQQRDLEADLEEEYFQPDGEVAPLPGLTDDDVI
jgi:hypothetical protein